MIVRLVCAPSQPDSWGKDPADHDHLQTPPTVEQTVPIIVRRGRALLFGAGAGCRRKGTRAARFFMSALVPVLYPGDSTGFWDPEFPLLWAGPAANWIPRPKDLAVDQARGKAYLEAMRGDPAQGGPYYIGGWVRGRGRWPSETVAADCSVQEEERFGFPWVLFRFRGRARLLRPELAARRSGWHGGMRSFSRARLGTKISLPIAIALRTLSNWAAGGKVPLLFRLSARNLPSRGRKSPCT